MTQLPWLPAPDGLAQRDIAMLRQTIAESLMSLGWDRLLGKQRGGEQTLLEHCLGVLDVLGACVPFFAKEARPPLSTDELFGMMLAAVAHDTGKATEDFQAYLRGETSGAGHVDAERIRATVLRVSTSLGLAVPNIEDIVSEAVLHDRGSRLDRGEIAEW